MKPADPAQRPGFGLASAALCLELDCNTVFDGSMGAPCPRCGSVMSHPLAAWLDRGGSRQRPAGPGSPDPGAGRAARRLEPAL